MGNVLREERAKRVIEQLVASHKLQKAYMQIPLNDNWFFKCRREDCIDYLDELLEKLDIGEIDDWVRDKLIRFYIDNVNRIYVYDADLSITVDEVVEKTIQELEKTGFYDDMTLKQFMTYVYNEYATPRFFPSDDIQSIIMDILYEEITKDNYDVIIKHTFDANEVLEDIKQLKKKKKELKKKKRQDRKRQEERRKKQRELDEKMRNPNVGND